MATAYWRQANGSRDALTSLGVAARAVAADAAFGTVTGGGGEPGGVIVQTNTGVAATEGTSIPVSVTAGTGAGRDVIAIINCGSVMSAAPSGFTLLGSVTGIGNFGLLNLHVYRKPAVTAGETSWTFTQSAAEMFAWTVLEVTGITGVDTPVPAGTNGTASSLASPSKATSTANVLMVAAGASFAFFGTAPQWQTWSGGYVEAAESGATSGSVALRAAVATLATTATGTYSTTATFDHSGDYTALLNVPLIYSAGGGSSDGTVTAVPATGSGTAVAPSVSGVVNAAVAAVTAVATALAPAPVVSGETVISGGGPATGTGQAYPPTVSVTGGANVAAVAATSTGLAVAPSLSASSTVTGAAATASATALPPAATGTVSATIQAVVATGTGTAVAPAVTSTSNATVAAVAATGTGAANTPTVSAGGSALVGATAATATGAAVPPAVSASSTATAVRAQATAAAVAPSVSAGNAANVTAVKATATAAAVAPAVTGTVNATLTAVAATSTGQALAPALTAGATITATTATGTGLAPAPSVVGTGSNDGHGAPRGTLTLTLPKAELTDTTTVGTLTITIPDSTLEVTA